MQGPVHQQGATYFNVEFDCSTVRERQSLIGRNSAARNDLELRMPADPGIFDVVEGEPVYMYTPKPTSNKKRKRVSYGAYPLVLSSINGLQADKLEGPLWKLQDGPEASKRFFAEHTFFGVATTPCIPDLNRRNHFVVARQGLISLRVAADTVAGDRIVVDFPCHHVDATDEAGAGTTACLSFGTSRLKKTLIFRPQRFGDVQSFRLMRANKTKKLLGEIPAIESTGEIIQKLDEISRFCEMEIGVAVSNANKGQLAKVVLHSSCF